MNGLDKIIIVHNNQNVGLIEFCVNNVRNARDDAVEILSKFEQKGSSKFSSVTRFFSRMGKQLLFVLQEQNIQGYSERVETAMAGLGIALHVALLAKTQDAHDDNKKAISDLTKHLAANLDKLENNHQETRRNQENKTIHVVVAPAHHRYLSWKATQRSRSKHTRQPRIAQTSTTEVLNQPVVASELPQVGFSPGPQRDLSVESSGSSDGMQRLPEHVRERRLESLAHACRTPDTGCELPPLDEQADNIEVRCEDGSVAFITAETTHDDTNEVIDAEKTRVNMSDQLSITRTTQDGNSPHCDADDLLEFLANDAPGKDYPTSVEKDMTK
ncbi:uncharacterized protein ColSpa_07923 [Colletotrichum spaethianum]|uniref:Uncharacterized protein n=1 Tax=Colletotrichum spaethianum TaxID=700344 RepID=A0AA37P8S0_9PEZI|nr:uncharacterized protein ColSpa_07923 [Colletotrichum spaethianum]GKT47742.1 hypothetical protein ColSpa_07923 [Colletotrichum spaethianum]